MEKIISEILKKKNIKILKKKNIKILKKNFNLDFFKDNLIDSIQFLEIITYLEKKFKIKFSNKEMSNQNFFSIKGIIENLNKKINVKKKRSKRGN